MSGFWYTFYPNHQSFRTNSSTSPLPEMAEDLDPSTRISGGIVQADVYNNGGEWLYSVFNTGSGQKYIEA